LVFRLMSDPTSPHPPPNPPDKGEAIPLEPLAASSQPPKPFARPPVVETVDDKCPNCGATMASDAVVCMSCGYDMQAGRVLKAETGVDLIEPPPVLPPFVKPGIKPSVLLIAGSVALVAAMIAAGVNAAPRAALGSSAVFALLVLYKTILHTGTGLAGVWAAALFVGHRLNYLNLAAARMFVSVAAFMLIWSLRIPISISFLEYGVRLLAALACYWFLLFALFRRTRQETTLIVLFHVGAAMFVELGFQIAVWLQTSVAERPGL
jgi:hypothetical protein